MTKPIDIYVSAKQESHRQKRVAEEIRDLLSQVIMREGLRLDREHEVLDIPKPATPITITHVQVSPDLRNATVLIMPLGGLEQKECLHYIKHCAGYLRWHLSKKLNLRVVPYLQFKLDDTFEKAKKIDDLLYSSPSKDSKED